VTDLTAMEIANASLLDEGTAAAEAMTMAFNLCKRKGARVFWVSDGCHPQTIEVVKTRALPLGIEVMVGDYRTVDFDQPIFGALLQYPATDGTIQDYSEFVAAAHKADALVTVAADLLSLTLLKPPGELGVDIVVGNTQRFGVPLGFGGPHAAFFATRNAFARKLPGRLVGFLKTATINPPCAWPCKPENSTFGAMRPPATSARPRCCWPLSPACMPSTTDPTGCARLRPASIP